MQFKLYISRSVGYIRIHIKKFLSPMGIYYRINLTFQITIEKMSYLRNACLNKFKLEQLKSNLEKISRTH